MEIKTKNENKLNNVVHFPKSKKNRYIKNEMKMNVERALRNHRYFFMEENDKKGSNFFFKNDV